MFETIYGGDIAFFWPAFADGADATFFTVIKFAWFLKLNTKNAAIVKCDVCKLPTFFNEQFYFEKFVREARILDSWKFIGAIKVQNSDLPR